MATERTLPISSEHRSFVVRVDGQEVPRVHPMASASVVLQARHVAWARIAWLDGAAEQGDFPLAGGDLFKPGARVEISAVGGDQSDLLFSGVVVRQSLRVREGSAPQLVVECRHLAMKLTVERRSAVFADQTDSEVIEALLSASGATVEVSATSVKHPQLVQSQCTDWDFLVARARANGLLVLPRADRVRVAAPDDSGTAVATLQYGATVLEFDAQIDAREQPAAVQVSHWDPAAQALDTADAAEPAFAGPGNLERRRPGRRARRAGAHRPPHRARSRRGRCVGPGLVAGRPG